MSYATYTDNATVAMHAATRAELNAPITGGKLAERFNSDNHGMREARRVFTYCGIEHYMWADTFKRFEIDRRPW